LFFRAPGEDLARAHDLKVAIREALAEIKATPEPAVARISKQNTRFSSKYFVDFIEKDK
jgi:hypothetical protein